MKSISHGCHQKTLHTHCGNVHFFRSSRLYGYHIIYLWPNLKSSETHPSKSGLNNCFFVYECDVFWSSGAALWGQPLMLYRYLLNLNSFLNSAASRTEGACSPGWRFGRDCVFLTLFWPGSFLISGGTLILRQSRRRAPCEGRIERRQIVARFWLISIRVTSRAHWHGFLIVGAALHCSAFFVTVTLVVDSGKDHHVEDEEDTAYADGNRKCSGCTVVVAGGESLEKLSVILIVVKDIGYIISGEVFTGGRAGRRWWRYCLCSVRKWRWDKPLVTDWTWNERIVIFNVYKLHKAHFNLKNSVRKI